jgi:hypothetical protein
VSEAEPATIERRTKDSTDRRKHSRSGRRKYDPHTYAWQWRRVAWLFAASAAFMSFRTVPAAFKRLLTRRRTT